MINMCRGCGVVLQSEDKKKSGYIPEDKMKARICMRCFRLSNYNDLNKVELELSNDSILKEVNKKGELAFFLVDFLNINSEVIETFKKISIKKVLVISKLDIIPRSIKKNNLVEWLSDVYDIRDEMIFLSAKTNYGITSIINTMDKQRISKAYLLGYTNAGKSTLVNSINEKYNNKASNITTSLLPNTTLGFIKIPVEELSLIDSPGFVMEKTFADISNNDLLKRINSKKALNPITYQMKTDMSIVIEDKIRILSDINNSWTFYMSNEINLQKLYASNNKLVNDSPFTLEINDNSDLIIKGLGFVNIKKACTITIYTDELDVIEIRKSCFNKVGDELD